MMTIYNAIIGRESNPHAHFNVVFSLATGYKNGLAVQANHFRKAAIQSSGREPIQKRLEMQKFMSTSVIPLKLESIEKLGERRYKGANIRTRWNILGIENQVRSLKMQREKAVKREDTELTSD